MADDAARGNQEPLPIVSCGDPVLRRPAGPVDPVSLRRGDLGLGREAALHGVVELLLADRLVAGEGGVAFDVEIRLVEVRLGLTEHGLGLRL